MDQLSQELLNDHDVKMHSSEGLKESIAMRSELPVFFKKQEILDVIRENSIVIIQGSTGCGKTTQASEYYAYLLIYCV